MKLQFVGHGWLNSTNKWKTHGKWPPAGLPAAFDYDRETAGMDLPELHERAEVLVGDSFTMPPLSFWVLRLTANNPGAWLFHCHMDPHLEAGMGFVVSVEDENGNYPLPPPSDDTVFCATPQATYGDIKKGIEAPVTATTNLA